MPISSPANAIDIEMQEPEEHHDAGSASDSDGEDFSEPEPLIEKWDPTIVAMCEATKRAYLDPASPSDSDSDRTEFRQYWWDVFTQVLESVAADSAIPTHLTSPPVTKFVVKVFDKQHELGCACGLPAVDPTIALENDEGVTKLDLVRELRDYLYGEASPAINTTEVKGGIDASSTVTMDTPLMYEADWMSGGSNGHGAQLSYYDEVPEIFVYCCPSSEFRENWLADEDHDEVTAVPKTRAKSKRAV